ncbi:hypothetical protein QUC31_014849, partial [Theobroma cacao]
SERCIIIAFEGYITIKARIFSWTISPSKLEYSLRKSCHINLCLNYKLEKNEVQFKFVLHAFGTASTTNRQMTLSALISLPPMIRFDEKNALVLLLDVRQQPQIPPDQQENHNRVTIKQLLQIDHSKTQVRISSNN